MISVIFRPEEEVDMSCDMDPFGDSYNDKCVKAGMTVLSDKLSKQQLIYA